MWLEFLSPNDMCGLCGNTGIVDTRGRMFTPAGVECGVRQWCICPNGRVLKAQCADIAKWQGLSRGGAGLI